MKNKIAAKEEIIAMFKDGQTIAVGGQANHGSPNRLIDCIIESGARHLTMISLDTGDYNKSTGRLIHTGQVDKCISAYVGKNSEGLELYNSGKLKIELVPMGSLIERIRCGGMGLGGVLTKTGVGTVVQESRETITVNGEDYLLETALRADVAISRARKADPFGNLVFHGTGFNSNPVVATAGNVSIVETDFMMDIDEIDIDEIHVPGAFVDMILA